MKQINKILIIAALSMLFWYSPAKAQENNGTLLDSLSEGDELLDSNLVYKDMYEDSLKDQGNWVKVVKSDFIKEVNGEDTELDELSTSGNDDYVYVWRPNEMGYNPYVNGRWVFTYDGWIWVSNYYWGWTCYHYGRWWYSPYYGWVWLPGRVWAPNWCYWREYGDYYGWHPYGPRIHWRTHHGRHHNHVIITHPTKWVFVNKKKINENITKRDVLKTNLKDVVKNSSRINTVNTYDEKVKYNGPDVTQVSVNTGKKIKPELVSTVKTRSDEELKGKKNNVSTRNDTGNNGSKNTTGYENSKTNKNKSTETGNNGNTYNGNKESNRNSNNGNRESTKSGNNGNRESTKSGNNGNRESTKSGNNGNRETKSGNNGNKSTTPKKVSENTNQSSVSTNKKESYVQKEVYTAPKKETTVKKETYNPPKQETKTYNPPKQETKTYNPPKQETKTYNPPKQENTVKRESTSSYRSDNSSKKESSNNNTSVRKK